MTQKEANAASPNAQLVAGDRSLKETLEVFGKIVLGLVGLCYVLGLIVVTIHLRKFGLNSLDLPQLHYVMAGVWTMLPILLSVLMIIFGTYVYQVQEITGGGEQKTALKRMIDLFYAVIVFMIAFLFLLRFFGSNLGLEFGWKSWLFIPLVGTASAFFIFGGVFLLVSPDGASSIKDLSIHLGAIIVGLCLGFIYLTTFSNNTYQKIPWSTGGGRPSQVQLMIEPGSKPYLEGVGLKVDSSNNRTESLRILMTTEKEIVLINVHGNAVSLPVATVKSIVYEK